jgi:hypothetical protein
MTDKGLFAGLLAAGFGLGAGLTLLLDPQAGRRRRALARNQVVRLVAKAEDAVEATTRDMANRARGLVAEARRTLGAEETAPDEVVAERVREKLGHYTSHPGSVHVTAVDGRVVLEGPILASEVDRTLRAVRRVRGVRDVESRLGVHPTPDGVPGLQGGVGRAGERAELLQAPWSPTARVLVGAAGAGLIASGGMRRGVVGTALGVLGASMLLRAATNAGIEGLLARAREPVAGAERGGD